MPGKHVNNLQKSDYNDMLLKKHSNLVTSKTVDRVRRGMEREYSWLVGPSSTSHHRNTSPNEAEPYQDNGPHRAIIAFKDATLRNLSQGHGRNHAEIADNINKVFGKCMEDLLVYPQKCPDPENSTLESNRRDWYMKKARFPGATDPGFSTFGVHWATFSELEQFFQDFADIETKPDTMSDDDVLIRGFKDMVFYRAAPSAAREARGTMRYYCGSMRR